MKTPAERGPFATWVVETRNALDLTAEWIAAQTGYDDATIRKLEGGAVTRPQRRKVTALLQLVAEEKGMRIPPPPGESVQPADNDLAAAIRAQAAAIADLAAAIREDRDRISPEALSMFLRQLSSEGLLLTPDTPASTDVSGRLAGAGR